MEQNKAMKVSNEKRYNRKRKSVFILLVAIFSFSFSFFSYVFSNQELGNRDFTLLFNGENKEVDSVIIDGYTYVKLRDVTDNTTLDLYWDDATRTVDVVDSSFMIFKEFDGKDYVNLTHFRNSYTFLEWIDIDIPYGMFVRYLYVGQPEVSYNSFFYSIDEEENQRIGFAIPSSEVLYDNNSFYMDYEFFKENLAPIFIEAIYENGKSKKEN